MINVAGIAQLVEQRIRNARVTCSSHATSSIENDGETRHFCYNHNCLLQNNIMIQLTSKQF